MATELSEEEMVSADHDSEDLLETGNQLVPLFSSSLTKWPNKLDCLSLPSLSKLVQYLRVGPEPSGVEHLSDTPSITGSWPNFMF